MFLYGASGHAKVIIDSLLASKIPVSGLFDDDPEVKALLDYRVRGYFREELLGKEELIISVGLNNIRKKIVEKLPQNINYGKVIHPSAVISDYALIGKGTVVMQGAVLQSNARIGNHCIINTASTVDHDCVIGDFVHISPNATLCGNVTVGEGCQVGAGAVVIPGIKIGNWSLIAAGAAVMKDVPDNVLVIGNPARIVKSVNCL
jgi:sugar O-acyltransferase (sialic acid O-acetyltransferase NeuD family)